MPSPTKQVMNYFQVFISLLMAICLADIHVMASHQAIHVIALACGVTSFWPLKPCPTAIKLHAGRIVNFVDIIQNLCSVHSCVFQFIQ